MGHPRGSRLPWFLVAGEPSGASPPSRRAEVAAFACLALWLALEQVALGPRSYARVHDNADGLLPAQAASARNLREHGLQYWLPQVACGVDRLGTDESYLRLTEWLFLLLPPWLAYQVYLLGFFFLTGYFTYRVCRDQLGLAPSACFFAGAAAALLCDSGIQPRLGFAILPLLLWSMEGVLSQPDLKRRLGGSLLLGALLAGTSSPPVSLPFALGAAILWLLLVRRTPAARLPAPFMVLGVCALALHAPMIASLLALGPQMQRSSWDFLRGFGGSTFAAGFRNALVNMRVLAAPPWLLLLAAAAVALTRGRDRAANGLAGAFVLSTVGSAALHGIKTAFASQAGMFRGFTVTRLSEVAYLFLAALGAVALHRLGAREPEEPTPWARGAAAAGGIALWVSLAVLARHSLLLKSQSFEDWKELGGWASNFEIPALKELAAQKGVEPFRVASIPVLGFHPSYAMAYGLETTDGYPTNYPRAFHRFWGKVIEPALRMIPEEWEYFNTWGLRPYLQGLERIGDTDLRHFHEGCRLSLLSLANTRYILSPLPIRNTDLRWLNDPPPREDLDWSEWLRGHPRAEKALGQLWRRNYLYVYENPHWFPRFFLVPEARLFSSADRLLDALGRADARELRAAAFIESRYASGLPAPPAAKSGGVTLRERTPDRIRLSVEADGSALLVASNNYSPYWSCRVNGKPVPLLPAYHAFWAVPVAKGKSEVVFCYRPPYAVHWTDPCKMTPDNPREVPPGPPGSIL